MDQSCEGLLRKTEKQGYDGDESCVNDHDLESGFGKMSEVIASLLLLCVSARFASLPIRIALVKCDGSWRLSPCCLLPNERHFLRGESFQAAFNTNMFNPKNFKPQHSSRSNGRRSLNGVVIGASFIAVLLGTGFWAIIEYFMGARPSWSEFLGHHLVPSLVTGLIIWVILSALLHRTVTEPLRHLFAHLYRVGSGRLEPISLDTGIAEIQTIVEGVNLLVHRLSATSGVSAYTQAQERLKKIRNQIRSMADAAGTDSPIFLDLVKELRALEGDVLSLGPSGEKSVEGIE